MCFFSKADQTKRFHEAMKQRGGEVLFYKWVNSDRSGGTDYLLPKGQTYKKGRTVHANRKRAMIRENCRMEEGIYVFLSKKAAKVYYHRNLFLIEVAAKASDLIGYIYFNKVDQRACFRKVRVLS